MRYIDIDSLLEKRAQWGDGAELWTNAQLKQDFKQHAHKKCWYTEIDFTGHDVHIDHFKPKAKVKPMENHNYNKALSECGYYWLKNDPKNYRASCIVTNRVTGNGGKGNYFPLKPDSPWLTEEGGECEIPLLIDPCSLQDVQLLSFVSGNKIESTSLDPYDEIRVDASCKVYNLLNPDIIEKRSRVWASIERILAVIEQKPTVSTSDCQPAMNFFIAELCDKVDQKSEFSACAISAIKSSAPTEIQDALDLSL